MAEQTLKIATADVKSYPDFRAGDTVRVHYRIIEGDKTRIQPYEGIVISRKGMGSSKSFTVRRLGADNIAIERIFPFFSPNIEKIELVKAGDVRRAKLYYLRAKKGRQAMRIKELVRKSAGDIAVSPEEPEQPLEQEVPTEE